MTSTLFRFRKKSKSCTASVSKSMSFLGQLDLFCAACECPWDALSWAERCEIFYQFSSTNNFPLHGEWVDFSPELRGKVSAFWFSRISGTVAI